MIYLNDYLQWGLFKLLEGTLLSRYLLNSTSISHSMQTELVVLKEVELARYSEVTLAGLLVQSRGFQSPRTTKSYQIIIDW